MTPDLLTRVETIERRVKQATVGPWRTHQPSKNIYIRSGNDLWVTEPVHAHTDAELIANAPTDLAFLCAEVRRQQERLQALSEWTAKVVRAHTYASENAETYRAYDHGYSTAQQVVSRLLTCSAEELNPPAAK